LPNVLVPVPTTGISYPLFNRSVFMIVPLSALYLFKHKTLHLASIL
jgi:hypothetical protein